MVGPIQELGNTVLTMLAEQMKVGAAKEWEWVFEMHSYVKEDHQTYQRGVPQKTADSVYLPEKS